MAKEDIIEKIEINDEVKFEIDGNKIILSKSGKEISREFIMPKIEMKKDGNFLVIGSKKAGKREKKLINTILAHIKNMINGFNKEYIYKLAVVYLHFPITLEIDKEKKGVIIKNFLGEKKPRIAKIIPGSEVSIEKNIITVKSSDKEIAGQTAANMEIATRIKRRDRRKFQDGIFLIERAGRPI